MQLLVNATKKHDGMVSWGFGQWENGKQQKDEFEHGAPVWKKKSITRDVYGNLMKAKLIPAITAKCPPGDRAS